MAIVTQLKGSQMLLAVLRSEGVKYVFGNPGTTELAMMDALGTATDLSYVLGLQEATVIGMADGYALATERPAFVNLHTAGGLGNAIGGLTNSASTNTPLVVTAGQQDYRHIVSDPLLSGDLVSIARPVTKWAHEIRTLGELGVILRRAFRDAASPPQGPVFVSLPMHFMEELAEADAVPPRSDLRRSNVASDLDELARILIAAPAAKVALVVGDEAADAAEGVVALAETLGVHVFGSPLTSTNPFPTSHPLFAGYLPPAAAAIRGALTPYSLAFLIGAKAFMTYPYTPGPTLPPSLELLHLAPEPSQPGRTYPVRLGLVGDPRASLAALVTEVKHRLHNDRDVQTRRAFVERAAELYAAQLEHERRPLGGDMQVSPMRPRVAAAELLRGLPPGGIVVDEAPATTVTVRELFRVPAARKYFFDRGGALGWGMPAAIGISLGFERAPVLCIVGDGSAMYAPQALWTAAHLELPIVFAVVNNREYGILKNYMRAQPSFTTASTNEFLGMDIVRPAIDFVRLAESFGVRALRIERAGEVASAVADAFKKDGPALIELPIAASGALA